MHRSYQSILPCHNKYLQQRWDYTYYNEHRRKVADVKPMVDTKAPRTYMHLHLKLKKLQLEEERLATIERDNRILLEKMAYIMRTRGQVDNKNSYDYKSLNREKRKRELLRITHENQEILRRITLRQPEYDHAKWQMDWEKNQDFMDNISHYPKDWWRYDRVRHPFSFRGLSHKDIKSLLSGDQEKLSKKCKVRDIPPSLILLDGETGKVITKDGRSIVTSDPVDYPWPTPTFAGVMTGCKLINRKQEEVDAMEALEGKVRGIYFSAHWCPPCQHFTPKLAETYNKVQEDGKKLEIIFVSSDQEETAHKEYLDTMPWLALKFVSEQADKLKLMFEVNGIPKLILLDENNKVISQNARFAVDNDPTGNDFPWLDPQPLNKLTGASYGVIIDELCFLLIGGAGEKEEDMKDAMKSSAEKYADKEDGPKFFYGFTDDVKSFFDYIGIKDPSYPLLLTINIPEKWTNLQTGISLSEDTIKGTLAKHEEGQLEHTPMKA